MQLIAILLVTVSVLALLSGLSVLLGASKNARGQGLMLFLCTIGVFGWGVSMAVVLTIGEGEYDIAKIGIFGVYLFTLVMDLFIVAYTGWKLKWSWIPLVIFALGTIFFAGALIYDPSLLYSEIILDANAGNSIAINFDWYYLSYAALCGLEGLTVFAFVIHRVRHSEAHAKKGWIIFLVSLAVVWCNSFIFDLWLPLYRYDLIWIGPVVMAADFVIHYYAILRYRMVELASSWLRILSHIIIMSLAAIIYLAVFFVIFIALFKVPSPSSSVIILTSIMIIVVLLLFPALNEISGYVRSLASIKDVDVVYLVKKLNLISKEYINYHELADLLADHLHFQYIGLLIGNKLYSSTPAKLSSSDLNKVDSLRNSGKGLWLEPGTELKAALKKSNVESIAELRDANGEKVGKILLGRPLGNITFQSRDLSQVETAISLTAAAISKSERGPEH